jgi:beta-carotene 15,15'-dioxygenase
MNKIQIQGFIFSSIAIIIALTSVFLPQQNPTFSLFILTTLIFFLGVPHGALDPVFAQKLFFLKDWKGWSKFVSVYLAISAIVVLLWWQLPLFFMASFLVCSVMHFSRDLSSKIPKITRLLYGGSMIVLPTIFHFNEMQDLFSSILDANTGLLITSFIHVLAWPWLIGCLVSIYLGFVQDWIVGLEILAVSLLSTLASPLLAFTVYFCGMHSLRHILRTKAYADVTWIRLSLVSLAPMLGVLLIVAIGWLYFPELPHYEKLLRFTFVGLAALTVPHMLLIDRISYRA